MYSAEALTATNELCRQHGCYHITDEAYEEFCYDDEDHFSPGSLSGCTQHTIGLFSFSKGYGMAGWRSGYMVIPEHLELAVKKVQDTNLIAHP